MTTKATIGILCSLGLALGVEFFLRPQSSGNERRLSSHEYVQVSIDLDTCPTGKEGYVWFLGESGLDFNSGVATDRPGFATGVYETQTSICDKDGNLLMYFDGQDLYDASHNYMEGTRMGFPNPPPLNPGGRSSTQSLFLKQPGNDSIYFLFFPEAALLAEPSSRDTTKTLWFSIININGNGGLGAVVGSKTRLLQPSTEKVTAVPHCNGKDYWVIGSEGGSNRFYAWLLTSDSLHQNSPIISSSGPGNDGIESSKSGYLKPSHNGLTLCEIVSFNERQSMANLHDFDPASGQITNGRQIISSSDRMEVYGCEFSPNNSKLYLAGYSIWQLDLWAGGLQDIRNSLTELIGINGGAPTLAPDEKIYVSKWTRRSFGLVVIDHPNKKGLDCNAYDDQNIISGYSGLGAPNFPAGFLFPERLYTRYPDTAICMDSLAPVWVTGPCDHHNTTWQLLDGGVVDVITEDSVQLTFDAPGTYRLAVQAESRCGVRYDTIKLRVQDCSCTAFAGRLDNLTDTLDICSGDTTLIPHAQKHHLGQIDTLIYVLHDRNDDTLGNILATFKDSFCFYIPGLQFNQVYYFSSVVTRGSGSNVDYSDPCISVAPGRPVRFRQRPAFTLIDVPTEKCRDSCAIVNLELKGTGPFSFWIRNAHYDSTGKFIPVQSLTNQPSPISFEWCQDTLNLSHIRGQYCDELVWDTTIVIQSIPAVRITSLQVQDSVCLGDSVDLWVQSDAVQGHLVNKRNDSERDLVNGTARLGPFQKDSCYTVRLINQVGCERDTSFCVRVMDVFFSRDTLYKCPADTVALPNGKQVHQQGLYPITLQSGTGCDSIVEVQVIAFGSQDFQASTQAACTGQANGSVTITSSSQSFQIFWPDGDTSRQRNDLSAGQYVIQIVDDNGCSDSVLVVIQQQELPDYSIQLNNETCPGMNDGWFAVTSDEASFFFNGIMYTSKDTISNLEPGRYTIEVTSSTSECTLDTTIVVLPGQEISIDLADKITLTGDSVELPLITVPDTGLVYSWSPADHLSCVDCPRPSAGPHVDMQYTVTVISKNGCVVQDNITVIVDSNVFVPSIFTPNGDQINDTFKPFFSDPDQTYALSIYNRWGELVYQCEGHDCAWDGIFHGEPAPVGVYVYMLKYLHSDRGEVTRGGEVTVVR